MKKIYILEKGLKNSSSHFFYLFSNKEKAIEFNGGLDDLLIEGETKFTGDESSALFESIIDSETGFDGYY